MDNHRRWYCRECKREWVEPRACYANSSPVSITGNPLNGPNCQVCGSPEIELVEYKPNYPGLDIPRESPNKIIESEIISMIPGTNTSQNMNFRNEPLLGREAKELIPPVPLKLLESVEDDIEVENNFIADELKEITPELIKKLEKKIEERESEIYDLSDMD